MLPRGYPFAALVGLDELKLALQLAAVDARLSVLLRGDKGAGKSTAARGLAELLPAGAPFVTLPIGATEDRLLGGLDIDQTLKGAPALKPGLLAQANGGVLYVDEVNLLADHLADALLDAAASGTLIVERDGYSASQVSEFILLGSMNPEEGALRPQLLDRFALAVDVSAPMDPAVRAEVLERRAAFDRDASEFRHEWRDVHATLEETLHAARTRLHDVVAPAGLARAVAERVVELGVRSLRADLAVLRASRACAALRGDATVDLTHVEAVLPLALAHRASSRPHPQPPSPPPPPPPPPPSAPPDEAPDAPRGAAAPERVFVPQPQAAPRVVVDGRGEWQGAGDGRDGSRVGQAVGVRQMKAPSELAVRATVVHALGRCGTTAVSSADLHTPIRAPRCATRFVLVVDSSGSHSALERMRLVKGVAVGLLDASLGRHDDVVVIACRGPQAEVLLEPTSSQDEVGRVLEYLPTGGRTPLAHGLELAAGYVTDDALVIVITDGRANVPTKSEDAWADACAAARALGAPALVIDTEDGTMATGRPGELATELEATCVSLADLDPSSVIRLARGGR